METEIYFNIDHNSENLKIAWKNRNTGIVKEIMVENYATIKNDVYKGSLIT